MVHPLVEQLWFARAEFRRGLEGVPEEDGSVRLLPVNSIGWIVAHLAGQERRYWLIFPRGLSSIAPELDEWGAYGRPATTPPLSAAWATWHAVTQEADVYLSTLTEASMSERFIVNGQPRSETIGTMLLRTTYHYWFHNGEASAIRQQLGHPNLPEFVGDLGIEAPYRPVP